VIAVNWLSVDYIEGVMGFLIGLAGIGILIWGFTAGIGTRESNKAPIFAGPVGCIVNGAVLIIAALLIWWGFF